MALNVNAVNADHLKRAKKFDGVPGEAGPGITQITGKARPVFVSVDYTDGTGKPSITPIEARTHAQGKFNVPVCVRTRMVSDFHQVVVYMTREGVDAYTNAVPVGNSQEAQIQRMATIPSLSFSRPADLGTPVAEGAKARDAAETLGKIAGPAQPKGASGLFRAKPPALADEK